MSEKILVFNESGTDYRFYIPDNDFFAFHPRVIEIKAYSSVEISYIIWKRLLENKDFRTCLIKRKIGIITKNPKVHKILERFQCRQMEVRR